MSKKPSRRSKKPSSAPAHAPNRTQKLKSIKEEAEKEVTRFKNEKDNEYKKQLDQVSSPPLLKHALTY